MYNIVYLCISLLVFFYTFSTCGKFVTFLSNHNVSEFDSQDSNGNNALDIIVSECIYDIGLLVLFVCQHSIMATDWFKSLLQKSVHEMLHRSVYVAATSYCLQTLMRYWRPIPVYTLWFVDTHNSGSLWTLFVCIHVVAWLIIFGACIMMDLPELLGLRQVYNKIIGAQPPLNYKSSELVALYSHCRHPGFVGLYLILWLHPVMTLGRVILALGLLGYMAVRYKVLPSDCGYLRARLSLKLKYS